MLKKYLIVILLSVLILSFNVKKNSRTFKEKISYQNKEKSTVLILEDSSILRSNIIRTFTCMDSVNFGRPIFLNKLETEIAIAAPKFLSQANEDRTFYYILPNEKIKIKSKDGSLIFFVEGNEQRTNELNFFRLLDQRFGSIYNFSARYQYQKETKNIEELYLFEKKINLILNNRLNFLDSFARKELVSKKFILIGQNIIRSAAIKDSLLLYWSNKNLLKGLNLYDTLIAQKVETINYIGYQPNFVFFNTCRVITSMSTTKFLDYELNNDSDILTRFLFVQRRFKGVTKDFLLTNTLFIALFKTINISHWLINTFYNECKDTEYRNSITKKLNEQKVSINIKSIDNLLLVDGKSVKSFQSVIKENRGKLVFLDFWASWCSPCREEIPYSKKLETFFVGKNIVYFFISLDESVKNWLDAIREEKLPFDRSFLLLHPQSSSFIKENKIQTIPRYILIGKHGEIISDDAPRPNDAKLKELIEKSL